MSSYREWFRLTLTHAYHGARGWTGWRARPGERSAQLLTSLGAVQRQVEGTLTVLLLDERMTRLGLQPGMDAGAPLLLYVDAGDPHFAAYTAPQPAPGQVLLADSTQAVREPSGAWRLHPDAELGPEALAPQSAPDDAPPRQRWPSPRAPVLVLRLAPPLPGPDAPVHYVVRLGAAASYWKYYLLDGLADRPLSIADPDHEVVFRRSSEAGPEGRPAAVFTSDRAMLLQARSARRFELREQAAFGDKVLMKRLPVACAGIRQQAMVDGHAVLVSEIFVNY